MVSGDFMDCLISKNKIRDLFENKQFYKRKKTFAKKAFI